MLFLSFVFLFFHVSVFFFFFNDTATTEIYTLSLHDALPITVWREHTRRLPSRTSTLTGKAPSSLPTSPPVSASESTTTTRPAPTKALATRSGSVEPPAPPSARATGRLRLEVVGSTARIGGRAGQLPPVFRPTWSWPAVDAETSRSSSSMLASVSTDGVGPRSTR